MTEFGETLEEAPLRRLVVIAGHVLRQRWNRVVEQEHGITSAGMNVLIELTGGTLPISHRSLAERCWVRPGSLTPVIDALARDGLVERHRDDQDRRVVWIRLTRMGRERVAQIRERLREQFPEPPAEADRQAQTIIRSYLIDLITDAPEGNR